MTAFVHDGNITPQLVGQCLASAAARMVLTSASSVARVSWRFLSKISRKKIKKMAEKNQHAMHGFALKYAVLIKG